MTRTLKPGSGSLAGLRWLASVGAAPMDAWAVAMGWGQSAVYSHASRLSAAGWTASCQMTHGAGSLIYPTPGGVRVAGLLASPLAAAPAPTTWAHCEACAWVAAWLTARGRQMAGPRELLLEDFWCGELEWLERSGIRRRGHCPDLAGGLRADGPMLPIEVELASKSTPRLRAILALHASWIAAGKTAAVIYVCGTQKLAQRIRREGSAVGLASEHKTLRVELLQTIRQAALAARSTTGRSRPEHPAAQDGVMA